jgi:hypothetical protein
MTRLALIASAILIAPSAMAQVADHPAHEGHTPATTQPPPDDHSQRGQPDGQPAKPEDHTSHDAMDHPQMDHSRHGMDHGAMNGVEGHAMTSALGAYAMTRDGSGTSWVPEASRHGGIHAQAGDWMLMGHASIDTVYTWQGGPRGGELGYVGGMVMGTAQRKIGDAGTLQLRGMMSPDPLMGDHGYPLLLAAGETADGVETLVDRQHPHDLFMELSASYSHRLSDKDSVFVYGGLPGEPAFGPPAFMHRPAAMANPEAPITHHWFDSTHITFGVVTAGWVHDGFKVEASRFRGREPDQDRYDIETGELDSTAVRLSWNPSENWALQASWADVTSPEQLEPDVDVTKYSASALYTAQLENGGEIAFTGAFARKDNSEDVTLDAWLGEASWKPNADWTIFSRVEAIETDELGLIHHGPVENVSRASFGVSRDFKVAEHVTIALGASLTQNWTSGALSSLYDGDPVGAMAFVRFKME